MSHSTRMFSLIALAWAIAACQHRAWHEDAPAAFDHDTMFFAYTRVVEREGLPTFDSAAVWSDCPHGTAYGPEDQATIRDALQHGTFLAIAGLKPTQSGGECVLMDVKSLTWPEVYRTVERLRATR